MKKIIIILFAISLYTPEAVQILDFSKCIFTVFTISSGNVCDCLLLNVDNSESKSKNEMLHHEHKQIEFKQVDKYFSETKFNFCSKGNVLDIKQNPVNKNLISYNYLQEVFHPPAITSFV